MSNWRVDLGNGYWYDSKPDHCGLAVHDIRLLEHKYKCRYVAEWVTENTTLKSSICPIFWSDEVHPEGSNWLAFTSDHGTMWYVKDGISASRIPVRCVVSNDKQVLFSKSHYDFRSSKDGSVSVDGGREYTRIVGNIRCERVCLLPQDGELKLIPETMAALMMENA